MEPIAAQLRESRRQIVELARATPAEAWSQPSPNPNWTYRDLLAHLAVGDWVCQTVLRAATSKEPLDMAAFADVDSPNALLLEERVGRSVEELIAEVAQEAEETQELLANLTEDDEVRTQEDAPMSLGEYLGGFPEHDQQHLADLRSALK